jgi:ubiquinone/menaquinone biosynthesis C-methylase UbiE
VRRRVHRLRPGAPRARRARAGAEGLAVQFEQADAENLQFGDGSFDVVLSTFGVMFTPNQERAAAEMARVCKPGGRSASRTGPRPASSAKCSS